MKYGKVVAAATQHTRCSEDILKQNADRSSSSQAKGTKSIFFI